MLPSIDLPLWVYTAGWSFWIGFFLILETLALLDQSPGDTLTEHVRPVIQSSAVGWVLGVSFLIWLLFHFAWPTS